MCNGMELASMRRKVFRRLESLDLHGGDSHSRLSARAAAVYEPDFGWTAGACEMLRTKLVMLMGEPRGGVAGPITGELRAAMMVDATREHALVVDADAFRDLCDAIDCVHAALEGENATLRAELAPRSKRDVLAEFATRWSAIVGDWDGEERRALLDEYEEMFELVGVDE